ncbi:MAG TPA: substrate-binding domain-containing protein [Anaerolineae bacterium]
MQQIQDFEPLKVLADSRRLAILRLLLSAPATLSQLGKALDMHPAQVRHHLKQLEEIGLVELVATQITRGFVEKYYQATAGAFVITLAVVPERPQREAIVAMGSHDPALDLLAQELRQGDNVPDVFTVPVGSLDGLIALRQGLCRLAGCHLLDSESGDYNLSYVRHLFPGEVMGLLTLAHRQQGLLVAKGNPYHIQTPVDLARPDITFVNRQRGTGTRLWLERELSRLGVAPQQVRGYEQEVNTHFRVAKAVATGQADVGLGVMAAARQFDLDFVPLFEERYELVMPVNEYGNPLLQPLLDYLQTAECRRIINRLSGYSVARTGEERHVGIMKDEG